MTEKQKTLKNSFSISGKGLHTGQLVNMTFLPAPEDHGFKFKRVDIEGQPIIPALAEFVVDISRGTVIGKNGVTITTLEHSLSALFGLGVDNCLIEIDGPEVPILDGSAMPFVKEIQKVGIVNQKKDLFILKITDKIEFKDEKVGCESIILPDDGYSIESLLSYPGSKMLSSQYASLASLDTYVEDIAPCKTFVFLHELEMLLKHNLIKGGDLDNALVIVDKEMPQNELDRLADLFKHPHIEVQEKGVLNNTQLIFDNEPARHKILDIVGDLALAGGRFEGKVIAKRPGHYSNTELAKKLRKYFKDTRSSVPVVDMSAEPLMDIKSIKEFLPHRPPFLLVDKVMSIESNYIIGVKNVTMNEPFFVGHFPDEPVMPGVMILEAMAQTGGIYVLRTVDEPEKYSTYFLKLDNVKFRKKVVPGDTLVFKIILTSPIRRGCAVMKGYAFVGDSVVTEAEFMAQIVKNK